MPITTMSRRGSMLLIGVLVWWLTPLHAADVPARMVQGDHSIEALLRMPYFLKAGRYTVHCRAWITERGTAREAYCYSMNDPTVPDSLCTTVSHSIVRARFEPALRAGKATDVYMTLMVIVDTTAEKPTVLAVPNNGVEREKYGIDYVAPQRLMVSRGPVSLWSKPMLVWMELSVDEHGKVTDYALLNASGVPQREVDFIAARVNDMEFIPGHYEGHVVPMRYVEPSFKFPPKRQISLSD